MGITPQALLQAVGPARAFHDLRNKFQRLALGVMSGSQEALNQELQSMTHAFNEFGQARVYSRLERVDGRLWAQIWEDVWPNILLPENIAVYSNTAAVVDLIEELKSQRANFVSWEVKDRGFCVQVILSPSGILQAGPLAPKMSEGFYKKYFRWECSESPSGETGIVLVFDLVPNLLGDNHA